MALRPNVVLSGRYRLEKRIRSTSDADMFLAYDALLHRPVSVVIPQPERVRTPAEYQVFVHRHQVASALHHRNIVAILDIGEDHDRPYVVSEHFVGDSLANIIEDEAPFVVDDVAVLIEQLARGLEHAYKHGIVHGDLTPDVVIIDAAGLAKVVDLGMIEGQFLVDSASREILVSNPYLPKGLQGNTVATHSLDIHALSAIAYEMLVGDVPRSERSGTSTDFKSNAGFVHPSHQNPSIPERAGDVVLEGLAAYGARSDLTAMQFSQALTNWRSMTVSTSNPAQPPMTTRHAGAHERFPGGPQSWPLPRGTAIANISASSAASSASRPRSRVAVHWLFLAVVIISIAALWTLAASTSPQDGIAASAVPDELLRLFQAAER